MDLGKQAARLSGWWLGEIGPLGRRDSTRPSRTPRRTPVILRFIGPFSVLVVAGIVVFTVLGFVLARQADDDHEAQHRQALQSAIEAVQAVSPDLAHVEPSLILILERASGLKDLKFDSELFDRSRAS